LEPDQEPQTQAGAPISFDEITFTDPAVRDLVTRMDAEARAMAGPDSRHTRERNQCAHELFFFLL